MRGGRRFFFPPEWDVNLFIAGVAGRGAGGDVAVQGLIWGSASVFFLVCLFALGLVGGRGPNFWTRPGPNDARERDLQKVKEK